MVKNRVYAKIHTREIKVYNSTPIFYRCHLHLRSHHTNSFLHIIIKFKNKKVRLTKIYVCFRFVVILTSGWVGNLFYFLFYFLSL